MNFYFRKPLLVAFIFAPLMCASCAESETDRRKKIDQFLEELEPLSGDTYMAKFSEGYQEFSEEDRELMNTMLKDRLKNLSKVPELTASMIAKQVEDPLRADRLVAECELKTGQSSVGEGAMAVAECVNLKW